MLEKDKELLARVPLPRLKMHLRRDQERLEIVRAEYDRLLYRIDLTTAELKNRGGEDA